MSEFVFARDKKEECVIVVDSPLETDISSGKWLVEKVKDISGAEMRIARTGKGVNRKKALIGTLSESPNIRKMLEKGKIIIGLDNPEAEIIAVDKGSDSLSCNKTEVLKSSMLRRFYLCPEDLGEQGFIVYKMDEETIILCGGTHRGTSYAVQTLINHLYLDEGTLKVEDLHTEKLPIFSQPAIPCRAVFTNIGGPDHIGHDQWVKEWGRNGEYDYKGLEFSLILTFAFPSEIITSRSLIFLSLFNSLRRTSYPANNPFDSGVFPPVGNSSSCFFANSTLDVGLRRTSALSPSRTHNRYPFNKLVANKFGLDEVANAFALSVEGKSIRVAVVP